jgi:hypothetical protein
MLRVVISAPSRATGAGLSKTRRRFAAKQHGKPETVAATAFCLAPSCWRSTAVSAERARQPASRLGATKTKTQQNRHVLVRNRCGSDFRPTYPPVQ